MDEEKDPQSGRSAGSDEIVLLVVSWDEEAVRRAFIRKVFCLLAMMLLVVTGMGSVTVFVPQAKVFFLEHYWIGLLALIPFLIVYFTLICIAAARRSFPCNLILLSILTVSMGLVVMTNCARADPYYVVLIFLVCTLCCLGIVLFAMVFRVDTWLFILYSVLLACLFYTAAAIIITRYYKNYSIVTIIFCAFGCIIWMGFLAFDARTIIHGRQRGLRVQPDEVVLGALVLFVDICYLFLCLFGIGGGRD